MKETDYKRCWDEFIHPKFRDLPSDVTDVITYIDDKITYHQNRYLGMDFPNDDNDELKRKIEQLVAKYSNDQLEEFASIVYFEGHFAHEGYKIGSYYWKFELFLRNIEPKIKVGLEKIKGLPNHKYRFHAKDTSYDDEEVLEMVKRQWTNNRHRPADIVYCNHKVEGLTDKEAHPFVIGQKHFTDYGDIDLKKAPCHHCGLPYSAHSSEKALIIKVDIQNGTIQELEHLKTAINEIQPLLLEHGIKNTAFIK